VLTGDEAALSKTAVPTIEEGVRGMAFVDAAVRSSRAGSIWTLV
jgi:hypothetical protein